jgi:hypothetical protein
MKRSRRFVVIVLGWTALFACGARTQLTVGEQFSAPSVEAGAADARIDARRDGGIVPADALPPIDAQKRDVSVPNDCPDADSTLVYLLSADSNLYSFFPPTRALKRIGTLACPTTSTANSMAVDRTGIAYANFSGGEVFRVSTATAACVDTGYVPDQLGIHKFGMGFVDDNGTDRLFVTDTSRTGATPQLATIDTTSFKLQAIGPYSTPLPSSCELTGTGDGRLFAFCIDSPTGSFIAEIDKSNATVLSLDSLQVGGGASALAFAFWGGSFWIFTGPGTGSSTLTNYDPATKVETRITTLSAPIVGAGVSTCAPL